MNAQGEDVVAGIRTPLDIDPLAEVMPAVYNEFKAIAEKLGSTPATVKKDVDWLTANEDYERPAVIPKRG